MPVRPRHCNGQHNARLDYTTGYMPGRVSAAARSQETTSLAPLFQTSGEVLVAFEASS